MQFPDARILIFSRVPRAGRVKTRLIPLLGEAGACLFHRACLEYTLARLADTALAPVELWLDSEAEDPALGELARRFASRLRVQAAGDLGMRMAHAAQAALEQAEQVVLVGTDAPLLDADYLEQGLVRLRAAGDVVMGPAEDGGYVLLGLRNVRKRLFAGMPWGTSRVARTTRQRCAELGLDLHELPVLWDIDRPADIARLCACDNSGLAPLQRLACQHLPRL